MADREDFPTSGATQPTPTGLTPTPTSTGSGWTVIFSRPSAWLATGTLVLLILIAWLLATHTIPPAQLDMFKNLEGGLLVLFGSMVTSVFHGDAR